MTVETAQCCVTCLKLLSLGLLRPCGYMPLDGCVELDGVAHFLLTAGHSLLVVVMFAPIRAMAMYRVIE
jgi:hypothetical protein